MMEAKERVVEYIENDFEDSLLAGWLGPGWYFWDEIGTHLYGPYDTKEEGEVYLQRFVKFILPANDSFLINGSTESREG